TFATVTATDERKAGVQILLPGKEKYTVKGEKHLPVEFKEHSDISILHPDKPLIPGVYSDGKRQVWRQPEPFLFGLLKRLNERKRETEVKRLQAVVNKINLVFYNYIRLRVIKQAAPFKFFDFTL
ncbi:MAG: hypothetical protein ACK5M7_14940, partial [Draconibacterium sp.]